MIAQLRWTLLAGLFWAGATHAVPYVINTAGQQIVGEKIRSTPEGTIVLTTDRGQTLTFQKGMYRQAFMDPPEEIGLVEALVKKNDLAAAAEILCRVKKRAAFLGWDQRAGLMLARIYLSLERFEDSVREYEALFAVQPALKESPKERARYLQALRGAGQSADAAQMIDQTIRSGSRAEVARAQIVRGDLKMAAGQIEEALLDYFRTTLLFQAQTDVQPEATYKIAVALQRLKDPRAADYFQKVIHEFPATEVAERARGELK